MTQADKGKNIFQSAIDAVSNRDEKAAIEAAAKHGQELETQVTNLTQQLAQKSQALTDTQRKVDQLTADLTRTQADLSKTQADLSKAQGDLGSANSDLMAARINLNTLQASFNAANTELQKYVTAEQAKAAIDAAVAAEKAKIMTEHELKFDESLSHLALKYYGSAYEPYWRVIYEANKELIGPDPGRVRPGMVLKIPVLPEELKHK